MHAHLLHRSFNQFIPTLVNITVSWWFSFFCAEQFYVMQSIITYTEMAEN